jgi:hypothetical protein
VSANRSMESWASKLGVWWQWILLNLVVSFKSQEDFSKHEFYYALGF